MVKKTVTAPDTEPNGFQKPSEGEHLFQVVDIWENASNPDVVTAKLEVVGGDEEGRSLLNRLSLDSEWKGFFATRMFLKACKLPYKGEIGIDTDEWIGCQFYATVIHDGKYANIDEYNYDKIPEVGQQEEKAWDENK